MLPRCCTKVQEVNAPDHLCFVFPLQAGIFWSGAEGIRTHALRRAKAARYFARAFSSLQKPCKLPYFCVETFPGSSGDLLGLLHGCCTTAGFYAGPRNSSTWSAVATIPRAGVVRLT